MAFFQSKFDAQITVYRLAVPSTLTGYKSMYGSVPFPATGKTIQGFKFDEAFWRTKAEENDQAVIPTLWDPSTAGVEDLFQPGIGDNQDLLVKDIAVELVGTDTTSNQVWRPSIEHGYYYTGPDEYYLYSDDSLTETATFSGVWKSITNPSITGGNQLTLKFLPKPGIPILSRSFKWNSSTGSYDVDNIGRKVVSFTPVEDGLFVESGDEILWGNLSKGQIEFLVNYETLNVVYNQQVVKKVGVASEPLTWEIVGNTSSEDNQEHHLMYSPIDRLSPIQISVNDVLYTVVESFTTGTNQVVIDYDLGILKFGTTSAGGKPAADLVIKAHYSKTHALEYEPVYSRNEATELQADLNPIRRFNSNGFVFVRQDQQEVGTLELSAELESLGLNYFGPLNVGNNFARLVATVKSKTDELIEGQEVFFEILSGPTNLTFGSSTSAKAISGADGNASTLMNPPQTIRDMGGVTDTVIVDGSGSKLVIGGYTPPSDTDSLFVFQVHTADDILGIPKSQLLSYYESYIQEEGTVSGQSKGPLVNINLGSDYSWISGAFSDFIKWEILHREFHGLAVPTTYDPGDLRTGKMTVVAVLSPTAVNPHTGTTPAFIPIQPTSYQVSGSFTVLNFDQILPATGSTYKSYLVVGPTKATIQAWTRNARTGTIVRSNAIEVLIDINQNNKGLMSIDAINSVPDGLLGNALLWDQENVPLQSVNITSTGLLPIGWRIRSPGITIASALDSITFLDINPLTKPYDTISHEFTVD
jgi:hypothetical protein